MALTQEQKLYYIKCEHEKKRADFFESCPVYAGMMQAEVDRLEAEDADYKTKIKQEDKDAFRNGNAYGHKKGSDNYEEVGNPKKQKDKPK